MGRGANARKEHLEQMLPKSGSPVFFRAGVVVIVVAPTDADLGVSPADAAVAGKARADLLAKIILVAGRRQHVLLLYLTCADSQRSKIMQSLGAARRQSHIRFKSAQEHLAPRKIQISTETHCTVGEFIARK